MSSLSNNLIVNGTIKYNAGTNLTAAVQPRLLYSGTITGTTGTAPTITSVAGAHYRRDIIYPLIIPSGYINPTCSVCPVGSNLTYSVTSYIYYTSDWSSPPVVGTTIMNILNGVAYQINYLIYATPSQA